MFSNQEKEVLRPVLGTSYSDDVLEVLKEKGINSKKGQPFSPSYIVNVFNAVYANPHIEAAILEVYKKRKEALDQLQWEKDQLLSAL